MNKIVTSVLSIILILAVTFSCTEEVTPTPYTYTKIFTGEHNKTWKLKFLEYTINGDIDDTFTVSCGSDDKYIFYANAEQLFEAVTGSKKCEEGEPDIVADSWTFSNATATLTMVLPIFTSEFSLPFFIRKVDKNDMELEIFIDNNNTESYRIHLEATDEE